MPVISFFYRNELNGTVTFIGTFEYARRAEGDVKIIRWCEAHGHSPRGIFRLHHFVNSIREIEAL